MDLELSVENVWQRSYWVRRDGQVVGEVTQWLMVPEEFQWTNSNCDDPYVSGFDSAESAAEWL